MDKLENKKNRIIQVAQEFFSQFGFIKTTVDEIAKKARMGKSSIYYYFKSKEDVFDAVLQKETKILKDKILVAINDANTPQEKIKAFIMTRMKYVKKLSNVYSALTSEYLEYYSFIQKMREDYDRKEIEIISNILNEGITKHNFKISNVKLTSFAISTALKGLEYNWAINTDNMEIETNVDNLVEILLYGIVKR